MGDDTRIAACENVSASQEASRAAQQHDWARLAGGAATFCEVVVVLVDRPDVFLVLIDRHDPCNEPAQQANQIGGQYGEAPVRTDGAPRAATMLDGSHRPS